MNTQKRSSKTKTSTGRKLQPEAKTIGIDIGDQWSHYCVLDEEGEVLEEGRLRTNAEGFAQHFASEAPVRIAMPGRPGCGTGAARTPWSGIETIPGCREPKAPMFPGGETP